MILLLNDCAPLMIHNLGFGPMLEDMAEIAVVCRLCTPISTVHPYQYLPATVDWGSPSFIPESGGNGKGNTYDYDTVGKYSWTQLTRMIRTNRTSSNTDRSNLLLSLL